MLRDRVFFVGPRYAHHSGCSGYESFHRYVGALLRSPVQHRFWSRRLGEYPLIGDLGWRIDQMVAALTPRPLYAFGVLAIEAAAGLHMLSHRRSLYHVLYGDSDLWLQAYAKRMTGNRLVATFHEPPPVLEWLKIQNVARHLDAAILVSESQRWFFERFLPPDRVFYVPHGVETGFFRPAGKLAGEPICITVGSKLRDFETLTRAMEIIWKANPEVRLIAIGTRRPKDSNPHFLLRDERIRFLDGVSDQELLRAYQSSRVALFPLKDATANNALLEAMACGLPVVATNVGGIADYLGEGAGFLPPPFNPEEFAKAALRLLEDRALAERMSKAGRERAPMFDYEKVGQQMARIYSSILDRTS